MCTWQICTNCVMLSRQCGPKSLRNVSAPYWLYTVEDTGSFESYRANPGVPNEVAIECKHHHWIVYSVYDGEMTCKTWCPLCVLVKFCKCFSASYLISLCCFKVSKVFMKSKCHWKNLSSLLSLLMIKRKKILDQTAECMKRKYNHILSEHYL